MGKGVDTRGVILDEAVSVACRSGLRGLTVGALAARVAMSKSGLFAHFGSKEVLQLQVLARAREEFIDAVLRPALAAPRGVPRLRELFAQWLACGTSDRASACLFLSVSSEFSGGVGSVRDQVVAGHRDLQDSIVQMVRAAVAEGQLRVDIDPEQFAHDLYAVMLGFHHAHRLMSDPAAADRARHGFERLVAAACLDGAVVGV